VTFTKSLIVIACVMLSSFVITSKVLAYNYSGEHWEICGETSVCYILTDGTKSRGFTSGINAADTSWDMAGANFNFSYQTSKSQCPQFRVGEAKGGQSYWDWAGNSTDVPDGVLATTFSTTVAATGYTRIIRSKVKLNYRKFRWINASGNEPCKDPQSGKYNIDIHSVALHEFGHWLRLGHTDPDQTPVMYSKQGCIPPNKAEVKRCLTDDDINGIQHIYPWP